MTSLPSCVIVIFGATGDLTKRKLIPALHNLHGNGTLHKDTRIIAIGRRDYTDEQLHQELMQSTNHTDDASTNPSWTECCKRVSYHKLEFNDDAAYLALKKKLDAYAKQGVTNRVFYLATSPDAFSIIIDKLHKHAIASKMPKGCWHRVVFEKPFGSDLASARQLNKSITKLFSERQIYRIDHYLGKEFVQNIMVLRFTNPIFEHLWNKKYIDNVQLIVIEKNNVGTRGGYYDHTGALRDMVQNHLLQLLAITTMEEPQSLDADTIRTKKVNALRAVQKQTPSQLTKNVVLGQYRAGVIDGVMLSDYTAEKDVDKKSKTETFAALKLFVNNKRWKGVPFYVRTGKALMHQYAEIVITFKQAPCKLFCGIDGKLPANMLVVRIQPDEGVKLRFNLKEQDSEATALPYTMDYSYRAEFGMNTKEAYERLLGDCLRGDQTLFTRWDEVEESWKIVDNIRKAPHKVHHYAAGSHGPVEANAFIKRDGREWGGDLKVKQTKE